MLLVSSRPIVVAVLLCCSFVRNERTRADDWPQFGRDWTRNAVSLERRPPLDWHIGIPLADDPRQRIPGSSRNIKWSAPLGAITFGDPVVADGLIWVGTSNTGLRDIDKLDAGVLACFRESDGKLLYRYDSPGLPKTSIHEWKPSSVRCSPYPVSTTGATMRSPVFTDLHWSSTTRSTWRISTAT